MDAFRILGKGAKFDLDRFKDDAEHIDYLSKKLRSNKEREERKEDRIAAIHQAKSEAKSESCSDESDEEEELQQAQSVQTQSAQTHGLTGRQDASGHHGSDDEESSAHQSSDSDPSSVEDSEDEITLLGAITSENKARKSKRKTAEEILAVQHEAQVSSFRNENSIRVEGADIPDPISSFGQLNIDYNVCEDFINNIADRGYPCPTPIQMQAIPVMLQNRDILACAPTGSGKTVAFTLPMLHLLHSTSSNKGKCTKYRALILEPTQELARQSYIECKELIKGTSLNVYMLGSEKETKHVICNSKQHVDILVCVPYQLIHMIEGPTPVIQLDSVELLVIDESDSLFERGFDPTPGASHRDQLACIYQACTSDKLRCALFSATFSDDLKEWCIANFDNVAQVYVGARNATALNIKQELTFVGSEEGKRLEMRNIFTRGFKPPILIFVQSNERAKQLHNFLCTQKLNVAVIHSDMSVTKRAEIIMSFQHGDIWILICTDLMGRGMDFFSVNLVINYDFPKTAISYIHRIGRSGRAGKQGFAVTFFTDDDKTILRQIATKISDAGCPVPEYMMSIQQPSKGQEDWLAQHAPCREDIIAPTEEEWENMTEAEREEVNSRNRILKRKQQKSDRKWNPRQKKRRKGNDAQKMTSSTDNDIRQKKKKKGRKT